MQSMNVFKMSHALAFIASMSAMSIPAMLWGGWMNQAQAQTAQTPQTTTANPGFCTAPEYRQFDFWLGSWDVYDYSSGSKGVLQGSNVIERIYGCALRENWIGEGTEGTRGTSLNIYYDREKKWYQTWVDTQGTLLIISGGIKDGKMVMTGEHPGRQAGVTVQERITWSLVNNDPNQVRQFWESSRDAGKTWVVIFDGLYVRKTS
jgi:hypothetical protein